MTNAAVSRYRRRRRLPGKSARSGVSAPVRVAQHYLVECSGVSKKLLNNPRALEKLCLRFLRSARVTVLHTHFHQFMPYGVTGIIIVAESHLAIHTWPEFNYCAVDFLTCKKNLSRQDPTGFFKKNLQLAHIRTRKIPRIKGPSGPDGKAIRQR